MKKVKLKLKWDELKAVHDYIQDSIGKRPEGLPRAYQWQWILVQSVMIAWSMKLMQKLVFKKPNPFTLNLDLPTASAFMLFFGWNEHEVTTYLGITVLKIQQEIQKQLA